MTGLTEMLKDTEYVLIKFQGEWILVADTQGSVTPKADINQADNSVPRPMLDGWYIPACNCKGTGHICYGTALEAAIRKVGVGNAPKTSTPRYCSDAGCLRKVLPPYIYCDKHQDNSSTPPVSGLASLGSGPAQAHTKPAPIIFRSTNYSSLTKEYKDYIERIK